MKFAFVIHPLNDQSDLLWKLGNSGRIRRNWGIDLLSFCAELHESFNADASPTATRSPRRTQMIDEVADFVSARGARTEGRFYQIPMDPLEILENPQEALEHIQEAVAMAHQWGAKIVGLGSLTGIVGGRGTHLAEHSPIAVTTGNTLSVYAALENLGQAAAQVELDLTRQTVAVVGIPGSIASALARLLAPMCRKLLLVARRDSKRAARLADELRGELLTDIPAALAKASVVVSATSSGGCIRQEWLRPGTLLVDVGVPTDVDGAAALRDDVLVISGGLLKIPPTANADSHALWFHHGMVPACEAETMVLALEDRPESYSLGQDLSLERVAEIGGLARSHGFDFSCLLSFGLPLEDGRLVQFRKTVARLAAHGDGHWRAGSRQPTAPARIDELVPQAAARHARYVDPVRMALGASTGYVKTFARGEGMYLWDAQGKRYLDCVAGFGATSLGHNHPAVVEAVRQALADRAPGFTQWAVNPYAAALAEKLATLAPPGLEMVSYAASGVEAVEEALKLARLATGRSGVVVCEHGYHGKPIASVSAGGDIGAPGSFGSWGPHCRTIPYGDLPALERALADRQYAAFLVEPIQAEAGIRVPPPGYLREAHRRCRRAGTLLVVDESQTALGRTGTIFAVEQEGIEPDVLTLGESLGGGLVPLAAMLARRDLWMRAYGTVQTLALHPAGLGGGSLACAAGLAALEVLQAERLPARAVECGRRLGEGLAALCGRTLCLREVRGQGLLLGIETNPIAPSVAAHWKAIDATGLTPFLVPGFQQMLDTTTALYIVQTLLEACGIYIQSARLDPRVLRIQPPLTIDSSQVDAILAALEKTCLELDDARRFADSVISKTVIGLHESGENARIGRPPVAAGTPNNGDGSKSTGQS